MIKVVKFGGSSVANATQFAKVKQIVESDSDRKFIVTSACGKDMADDFAAMERLHALSGVKIPPSLAALKDMDVRFTRSIEIEDGMQVIADRMKEIGNVHD